jgi:hypothetical protein
MDELNRSTPIVSSSINSNPGGVDNNQNLGDGSIWIIVE